MDSLSVWIYGYRHQCIQHYQTLRSPFLGGANKCHAIGKASFTLDPRCVIWLCLVYTWFTYAGKCHFVPWIPGIGTFSLANGNDLNHSSTTGTEWLDGVRAYVMWLGAANQYMTQMARNCVYINPCTYITLAWLCTSLSMKARTRHQI